MHNDRRHFLATLGALGATAALPLAALQSGRYTPRADEKVCLIICGANLDLSTLA